MSASKGECCVLCGHQGVHIIRRYNPQSGIFRKSFVSQCMACKLVQTTPIPTADQLYSYYSESYRSQGAIGHIERSRTVRQESQTAFIEGNLQKQSFSPKNVLDIGAGHGQLLSCLAEKYPNAKLYATEVDNACCKELAARGIETKQVILDDLEQVPFDTKFDLIVCSHVLEHARNPKKFLRFISEMLAPGGFAMLEVPNCGVPYNYGGDSPHLTFFSNNTFRNALTNSGMEVSKLMTGGISGTEYVAYPTVKVLVLNAVRAWLADSRLPEGALNAMKSAYRAVRQGKSDTAKFAGREEQLENLYRTAFFDGAEDGTFLRAMVTK